MSDDPILLDERRGMAAQRATEGRRRRSQGEENQAALRRRAAELESRFAASPAADWREAAEKARYLLGLFAATSAAQDLRRQRLIARVLEDFAMLSDEKPTK